MQKRGIQHVDVLDLMHVIATVLTQCENVFKVVKGMGARQLVVTAIFRKGWLRQMFAHHVNLRDTFLFA